MFQIVLTLEWLLQLSFWYACIANGVPTFWHPPTQQASPLSTLPCSFSSDFKIHLWTYFHILSKNLRCDVMIWKLTSLQGLLGCLFFLLFIFFQFKIKSHFQYLSANINLSHVWLIYPNTFMIYQVFVLFCFLNTADSNSILPFYFPVPFVFHFFISKSQKLWFSPLICFVYEGRRHFAYIESFIHSNM